MCSRFVVFPAFFDGSMTVARVREKLCVLMNQRLFGQSMDVSDDIAGEGYCELGYNDLLP